MVTTSCQFFISAIFEKCCNSTRNRSYSFLSYPCVRYLPTFDSISCLIQKRTCMLQENTMLSSRKSLKENLRKKLWWRCCAGWKRLQGIGALSARTLRLLPITPTQPSSTRPVFQHLSPNQTCFEQLHFLDRHHVIDALAKRIYKCSIDFFSQCFHAQTTKKGNQRFPFLLSFFCTWKNLSTQSTQRINKPLHRFHSIRRSEKQSNARFIKSRGRHSGG